jgi:ribosome small subunit-dependent GTPase A/glutamate racemase
LDSGIGGLPYAEAFRRRNPREGVIYLADRAHFPYGRRSREELTGLLCELLGALTAEFDPKLAALVCNTASVSALASLRERFPRLPLVGTVPAMKPALLGSRSRVVGVLGTDRTIADPCIGELAARYGADCAVKALAAADLVEFVELRLHAAGREERRRMVLPYIEEFRRLGADAVVLGCTHFLFLLEDFKALAAADLEIYDSLEGVVRRIEALTGTAAEGPDSGPEGREERPAGLLLITGEGPAEDSWRHRAASFGLTLRVWGPVPSPAGGVGEKPEEKAGGKSGGKPLRGRGRGRGVVLRGSRNLFMVRPLEAEGFAPKGPSGEGACSEGLLRCRFKGKVLKGAEDRYNPLAPGDRVYFEEDGAHPGTALILDMEERRNGFTRFNQKGRLPQLLAANVDLVLCVTSPASPPFRPRFLDRLLLQAEIAGISPVILVNKDDLSRGDPDVEERLEDYLRIGYRVLRVSALTGQGMDRLVSLLDGSLSVLVGQSGVGKSSLINALKPALRLKTAAVNEKYDRGNHTTTMAELLELSPGRTYLIDTPGIRRFSPEGAAPEEIIHYMREFAPLAGLCTFGLSCSHRTEPGCKIMEAVAAGSIHEDRYESFLRIREELAGEKST